MRLDARVVIAERGLDAAITVDSGRTLALLGPNGSGKSSLLNVLAGLLRPDAGFARLGDATLFDLPESPDSSSVHLWRPANERPIGLLGQEPMLFPHLSALDNVAFPARARRASAADARAKALEWLARVDATDVVASRPRQLSGGQAQRVAIARALAAEPSVLLLDEPLSALDIDAAVNIRSLLSTMLAGRTAIMATHDVVDASMLADDIAVMHDGRIVETGPVSDVLTRPQHSFTARMAGRGLLRGVRTATGIRLPDGTELAAASADDAALGTEALLTVRPRAVSVVRTEELKDSLNTLSATVTAVEAHAESLRIWVGGLIADLDLEPARAHHLNRGDAVTVSVDPTQAEVYSARFSGS